MHIDEESLPARLGGSLECPDYSGYCLYQVIDHYSYRYEGNFIIYYIFLRQTIILHCFWENSVSVYVLIKYVYHGGKGKSNNFETFVIRLGRILAIEVWFKSMLG